MEDKVLQTIKKYNLINKNDKIVVGVSGGPDSVSLLHILSNLKSKLDFEIVVAHLNHMIREEADEETEYVRDFCEKLRVECYIKRVNILEKSSVEKTGTEETGRKARYDFFEEVLVKTSANKIATAHNANDNAETVLMNIIRGAGTSGLKGIEPMRDGKFIRPLIECERSQIEEYCDMHHLNPKIDKSNFENVYTRNKVRNLLIPQIKSEFNSNIIESLNKLSMLARQENEFIHNYVDEILNRVLIEKEVGKLEDTNQVRDNKNDITQKVNGSGQLVLNLKKFNEQDEFVKGRIILAAIKKVLGHTQGIEKIHVDDIVRMCSKNIGNKYLTPNKYIKVMVKSGKIYFNKTS